MGVRLAVGVALGGTGVDVDVMVGVGVAKSPHPDRKNIMHITTNVILDIGCM